MPLDISHLTVKANLKSSKNKKGDEKNALKLMQKSHANTIVIVQQMLVDFVPMVRDDMHDRLNR